MCASNTQGPIRRIRPCQGYRVKPAEPELAQISELQICEFWAALGSGWPEEVPNWVCIHVGGDALPQNWTLPMAVSEFCRILAQQARGPTLCVSGPILIIRQANFRPVNESI